MPHPMSMPWLDWQRMDNEPRDYEKVLYLSEDDDVWVGNHPEGRERGLWYKGAGGSANGGRDPIMWARIPLPWS